MNELNTLKEAVISFGLTSTSSDPCTLNVLVHDVKLNIELHEDEYGCFFKVIPIGDTFDMFCSETEFVDVARLAKKINTLKKQLNRLF